MYWDQIYTLPEKVQDIHDSQSKAYIMGESPGSRDDSLDGALRWSATPAHIPLTSIAPSLLAGVAHRTFPQAMRQPTGVGSSLRGRDLLACVRGLGLLSLETPGVFTQLGRMCSFLVS